MTLFMVMAACYGVIQLAFLGWFTGRTVRIGTLMLCVTVGMYACGPAALALQYLYTRGLASMSGTDLSEVVRTASYTVDPVIEEIVKVTPLLLLASVKRIRKQGGLTDVLLLGAGLGAGFGLLEAVLRFSHRASAAIDTIGGWLVPLGFSATFVPDPATILSSWLPAPASSDELFVTGPETFMHLAWSAAAGLGVGILLRGKGSLKLLGLLPIAYVSFEHAATNHNLTVPKGSIPTAHEVLWLLPLVALAIAAFFDRRDIARGGKAFPDVQAELGTFLFARLPWTVLIGMRFIRARRSLFYAQDEPLHEALRQIRDRITRATAWQKTPSLKLHKSWQLWVWLALSLPCMLYFVITDFPSTSGFQTDMEQAGVWKLILPVFLIAGLFWLAWRMLSLIRAQIPPTIGEPLARNRLRLLAGLGGLLAGTYALLQLFIGTKLNAPTVRNFHVLDALAAALLIVLVLLALALVIAAFPPGGLVLAGAGGAGAGAISISGEAVVGAGIVGALSWIMLMSANNQGGSAGPGGPERDGIRLDNTGKLHSPNTKLPDRIPGNWTTEELEELADDLRTSIANRNAEQARLGENTPAGPAHRARIAEEERFLRMILKKLSGT